VTRRDERLHGVLVLFMPSTHSLPIGLPYFF
jgi:hypothetical protein